MIRKFVFLDRLESEYFISIPFFIILVSCPVLYNTDNLLTGIISEFVGTEFLIGYQTIAKLNKYVFYFNRLDLFFIMFAAYYAMRLCSACRAVHLYTIPSSIAVILVYFSNKDMGGEGRVFTCYSEKE